MIAASSLRPPSERGTVAIIVAISATMIFALCALAVDLGSAFARKRDIQTQADLAALAAGAKLPVNDSSRPLIAGAAQDYAVENEVAGQDVDDWDFTDGDKSNGYIEYIGANKLRLFAPSSEVDFWLAPIAGLPDSMKVSALAAVEILTPGQGMPFFVSSTCGWGLQTILDATSGPPISPDYVPTLSPSSAPASSAKIAEISPDSADVDAVVTMTLTATTPTGFSGIDKVGFTAEASSGLTVLHREAVPNAASGDTLTVEVPSAVLDADAIWWVRVHKASSGRWSSSDNAKSFVVGDPETGDTSCDSKNSGNFGSLSLSRNDVDEPSRYLVENMAQGLQHGLETYPEPYPTPPDGCADEAEAVVDTGTPIEGDLLNCLVTDTGSDLAQKATDAFITGTDQGSPARLDVPTKSGCDPDDRGIPSDLTQDRPVTVTGNNYEINNDVLSCFLEPGVTVEAVTKNTGAPLEVIDESIFDSPRFFWIPVLVADPSPGSAGSYAIIEMRPVFITAQDDDATRDDPKPELNPDNGVEMSVNGIEKIRIRAINWRSLPEFSGVPNAGTIPYVGSGTKVVQLVE